MVLNEANQAKLKGFRDQLAAAWAALEHVESYLNEVEGLDDLLDDEWESIQMMVGDLDDVIQAFNSVLGEDNG